mgnify:FL=1
MEYAYKIEGLEREWVNIGAENQITLRNMPFGTYTFRVKARLRNGEWDEKNVATMSVRIHPPLWLTWYAWTFYGLLALSALWLWNACL